MNTILLCMNFWAVILFTAYVHDRFEKQYVLIQAMNVPCPGIQ